MSAALQCDPAAGWWLFLVALVGLYACGLAGSFLAALVLSSKSLAASFREPLLRIRKTFTRFVSHDKLSGNVLAFFSLFCNAAYIALALYYTSLPVKRCTYGGSSPALVLELLLSSGLLLLFVLRFLAAHSPLRYWLSVHTAVDVLTLPHSFLVLLLGKDWLGLRTLRFLWLTEASTLFKFLSCCSLSQDVVNVVKLVLRLIGMWLAMAGLVQLLEASGDPWNEGGPVQNLTYLESAYFVMVTMSTVGYGDITPVTVSGRTVITLFILTGLAVYATALPTLVDVAVVYYHTSSFTTKYCSDKVSQFVVVCGHITAVSVEGFLKELLHPDRHDKNTHILFLHPAIPSPELRRVLKTHYMRVDYLMGSPLSSRDLHRCALERAKACIVLADRFSKDPLDEDRANLLQVVSVKNTVLHVPVILQLLCGCSKELLHSIPGWSKKRDVVLCVNELRLKILAQGCLTPGFSTLISNLFFASSPPQLPRLPGYDLWRKLYAKGACKEIYSNRLSASFTGMRVTDVARLCFREMSLLLVAVTDGECCMRALLQGGVIQEGAIGYFIADRARDVELAGLYCGRCHRGIWEKKLCKCFCGPQQMRASQAVSMPLQSPPNISLSTIPHSLSFSSPKQCNPSLARRLEGHIVLCVFASAESTPIGLGSFISPLSTAYDIVVVSNAAYLEKETVSTSFPSVHCVSGSPLDWTCLVRAGIEQSHMCVILSAPLAASSREEEIRLAMISHLCTCVWGKLIVKI